MARARLFPDSVPVPEAPTRKSPRRRRNYRLKPTNVIHHQLLLGPTLARRAKKQKQKEQEQSNRKSIARSPQFMKKVKKVNPSLAAPLIAAVRKPLSQPPSEPRKSPEPPLVDPPHKTAPKTPPKQKQSTVSPVTPESVQSKTTSSGENAKTVLEFDGDAKRKERTRTKKTRKKVRRRPESDSSMGHLEHPAKRQAIDSTTTQRSVPDSTFHETLSLDQQRVKKTKKKVRQRPESDSSLGHSDRPAKRRTLDSTTPQRSAPNPTLHETLSLDQLRVEQIQRRLNVLKRRKLATDALMTATDVSSIFSSLWAFRQLHNGIEIGPVTQELVSDAQSTGNYLLTQWLMERFTSPPCFGGLGYSDVVAKSLINRILRGFGLSFGALDITSERLAAIGLPRMVTGEILPHLTHIVGEVREKIHCIFRHLMEATNDDPSER